MAEFQGPKLSPEKKKNLVLCKIKIVTHNYGKEVRYPQNVVLPHAASRQQIQCKQTDMRHRYSNCM